MKANIKEKQIKAAARHFERVYKEEIDAGEVDFNTIHEWWSMTVDQYSELSIDDLDLIEKEISY